MGWEVAVNSLAKKIMRMLNEPSQQIAMTLFHSPFVTKSELNNLRDHLLHAIQNDPTLHKKCEESLFFGHICLLKAKAKNAETLDLLEEALSFCQSTFSAEKHDSWWIRFRGQKGDTSKTRWPNRHIEQSEDKRQVQLHTLIEFECYLESLEFADSDSKPAVLKDILAEISLIPDVKTRCLCLDLLKQKYTEKGPNETNARRNNNTRMLLRDLPSHIE
jgi:hypothetical protein